MINEISSNYTASISDLKKSPMGIMEKGESVAILNRNQPVFYCVPPDIYEALLDIADEKYLAKIIEERRNEKPIKVSIDDL